MKVRVTDPGLPFDPEVEFEVVDEHLAFELKLENEQTIRVWADSCTIVNDDAS